MRKMILRRMKKLLKLVDAHGRRYCEPLEKRWDQTELSRKQALVILHRRHMRGSSEGEELRIPDKILSLCEKDTHVILRSKSGAEIEFGNALYPSNSEHLDKHGIYDAICPKSVMALRERLRESRFRFCTKFNLKKLQFLYLTSDTGKLALSVPTLKSALMKIWWFWDRL